MLVAHGDGNGDSGGANAEAEGVHRRCKGRTWRCALPHATSCGVLHDKEQTQREVHAHAESIAHGDGAEGGRGADAEVIRVLRPRAEELGSAGVVPSSRDRTALLCSHEEQVKIARKEILFPCDSLEIASW